MFSSFRRNILSASLICGILINTTSLSYASQIGTGIVVGSGGLTAPINWNDTFIGSSASGSINGITVTARILPTLSMTISGTGTIALGNLSSLAVSTGSVAIEIGTNALNGASVTARSTNAGLTNTTSGALVINSLVADGFADSYKFISSVGVTDSTAPGFTQSGSLNIEVNSSVTNYTLYTSTRPQPLTGVNDMTFFVTAQPNGQTPAGDYRDIIVVTVSGNF